MILAGCVATPQIFPIIPDILGRRASPSRRLARLGATPDFHHGLLAPAAPIGQVNLPYHTDMDGASSTVHIRSFVETDLDAILAIYNNAIETLTAVFEYQPYTMDKMREWVAAKQEGGFPILVADLDNGFAGFATYGTFRARPAYKYSVEHSVYVAERARRRGIARVLMEALIADARQRGYHTMIGGVVADNDPSLRFHESLGFVEVAHVREVGYKFGRWLDLKFLQLVFETPANPTEG